MSRYIDAEWLKEHTEFISYTGMWHETETGEFVSRETMEEAPSIDIVFCKECISADEKPIADGRYWCNIHGCYMRFCSDGEREGE